MTASKFPDFISTYQKVLLSDWPVIAKLIYKHSFLLKNGGYDESSFESSPTNVLSEAQITDALQGPYSAFFLDKIKSFSTIARLRMAVHIDNEDNIKDNLTHIDSTRTLPKDDIERFSRDELLKIQEAFDDVVKTHSQQWEGKLFFWQVSLIGALNSEGLALSEHETKEFNAAEPLSELLERYQSSNVTPPTVRYPLSFADYFRLKCHIAVFNALSRQHQPSDEKHIEKHMKALKKPLHAIEKEAETLRKEQAEEAKTVMPGA